MALPTLTDFKAYQRIEHTAEDALLTALLARARAMIELWVDCPIVGVSRTAYDPPGNDCGAVSALVYPWRPIGGTVTVVDGEGNTVDATLYRVDRRSGMLYPVRGATPFLVGPFAITATVGLDQWDNYATIVEPLLGQVILDLASDLYSRRTPMALSETGAGTTVSWDASRKCVERSLASLSILKLPVGL